VEDYRDEMREFVLRLYEKAAGNGARFFVDKTPPYYFIAEDIMSLFPGAKFVFVWRNPLSIVASIIDTFHAGRFYPTASTEDLFVGLPRLVAAYLKNTDRVCAVRFEDLVEDDVSEWKRIMDYVGIEFDLEALARFAHVDLRGRMGDPTGRHQYRALSTEPTDKWRQTLSNPIRKEWCRRYLWFLGPDRLKAMGYDQARLLAELDAQPVGSKALAGDLLRLVNAIAREPVRARNRRHGIGGPSALRELLSSRDGKGK
jgi:hypothetical protein